MTASNKDGEKMFDQKAKHSMLSWYAQRKIPHFPVNLAKANLTLKLQMLPIRKRKSKNETKIRNQN